MQNLLNMPRKSSAEKTPQTFSQISLPFSRYIIIGIFIITFLIYKYGSNITTSMQSDNSYIYPATDMDLTHASELLSQARSIANSANLEKKRIKIKLPDDSEYDVYYLEATMAGKTGPPVILLHGMASNADGTADVWMEVNTMKIFAADGYHVYAPDLPGTPTTRTKPEGDLSNENKIHFVREFMNALKINKAILYGASWGGTFALPFFMFHTDRCYTLVAVCPVGSGSIDAGSYANVKTPVLVIHGEKDERLGYAAYEDMKYLSSVKHVVVAEAGHAVFQQRPHPFHAACLQFMREVTITRGL